MSKRQVFVKVLKQELIRELQYMWDVAGNRAIPRDQFMNHLVSLLDNFGSRVPVISEGVKLLVDTMNCAINVQRSNEFKRVAKIVVELDLPYLEILADIVSKETMYRYETFIVDQLSDNHEDGVIPFAKVGVARMLEKLARTHSGATGKSAEFKFNEANFLVGLIEGRSGSFVTGWTNHKLKLKSSIKTQVDAEVVYARSGFRHIQIVDKKIEDQLFTRNHPPRHHDVNTLQKLQQALKGELESSYNFGYTANRKRASHISDPKSCFAIMPMATILKRYDYEVRKPDSFSQDLQSQLKKSYSSITRIAIDLQTFQQYLDWHQQHPQLNILQFTQQVLGLQSIECVQCSDDLQRFTLKEKNLSFMDLSGSVFGGDISGAQFQHTLLTAAQFYVKRAVNCDFYQAYCPFMVATNVNFTGSNFNNTNCSYANFDNCILQQCSTLGTIWHETILTGVKSDASLEADQKNQLAITEQAVKEQRESIQQLYTEMREQRNQMAAMQSEWRTLLSNQDKKLSLELKTQLDVLITNQLQEQKSQDTNQTEANKQLQEFKQSIEDRWSKLQEEKDQSVDRIAKLQEFVGQLINANQTQTTQWSEFQKQFVSMNQQIQVEQKQLLSVIQKVEFLMQREEAQQSFQSLCKEEFRQLHQKLQSTANQKEVEQLQDNLKEMKDQLNTLSKAPASSNHSELKEEMATLKAMNITLHEEVTKLENSFFTKLKSIEVQQFTRYDQLEKSYAQLNDSMNHRMQQLEGRVDNLEQLANQGKRQMSLLERALEKQNIDLVERINKLEQCFSRLSAVQRKQEEHSAQIILLQAELQRKSNTETVAELNQNIQQHQQQIRNLAQSPILQQLPQQMQHIQQQVENVQAQLLRDNKSQQVENLNVHKEELERLQIHFDVQIRVHEPQRLLKLLRPQVLLSATEVKCGKELMHNAHAIVYQGSFNGHPVVIKQPTTDDDTLFIREVNIMYRLQHSQIVRCYGVYIKDDQPFEVLECMEQGSLYEILNKKITFSLIQKTQIMLQITAGLQYMHSNGVFHRNLSTAKVLMNSEGHAKLTGFKRAKLLSGSVASVSLDTKVDTDDRWYSPEYIREGMHYGNGRESDIYSLGLILWSLFTGVEPYHGLKQPEIKDRIGRGSVEPIPGNVPEVYRSLIAKCRNRDPLQRPSLQNIYRELEWDHHVQLGSAAEKLEDKQPAFEAYTKAAELGSPRARTNLAFLYLEGKGGIKQNKSKACELLLQSAEAGHERAMTNLAEMLALGDGVPVSTSQSLYWYKTAFEAYTKSTELGSTVSRTELARFYSNGLGGVTTNKIKARDLWLQSAAEGHASAMFELSKMFEAGDGIPVSLSSALDWYQKAILQGYPEDVKRTAKLKRTV